MKKTIATALLLCVAFLSGCTAGQDKTSEPLQQAPASSSTASSLPPAGQALPQPPDTLTKSYYLAADDPVAAYVQNRRVREFWDMWAEEYFKGEGVTVRWDYDSLAQVGYLDHDFISIADDKLYSCIFTTSDERCGYLLFAYDEEGPSTQRWSLHTSPYPYDLLANGETIMAGLADTDIDLSTATATRVEWIDTDKNRGDRIILFEDGRADKYICVLGGDELLVEKIGPNS